MSTPASASASVSARTFTYNGVKFIHTEGRWIVGFQDNGVPHALFGPMGTKVASIYAAELSEAARRTGFRFTAAPVVETASEEKKVSTPGAKRGRPAGSGNSSGNSSAKKNVIQVSIGGAMPILALVK